MDKENEALDVKMQLQFAEKKISTYEGHIEHLEARIKALEDDLTEVTREKKEVLSQLKKKEAEVDNLNIQVVNELKMQLKQEKQKLEKVSKA